MAPKWKQLRSSVPSISKNVLDSGYWILLDELNLATQSVLEGLNACLDHRAEIFIPELNKTFSIDSDTTKIFATQNPPREGGERKNLPKSFLNRFVKVMLVFTNYLRIYFFSHIDKIITDIGF